MKWGGFLKLSVLALSFSVLNSKGTNHRLQGLHWWWLGSGVEESTPRGKFG